MKRYCIEVAYNGKNYSGFQVQHNAKTIQGEVENALFILLKEKVSCTGASRTDAGVHAMQNFFHIDLPETLLIPNVYNLNAILPPDIAIAEISVKPNNFHARFDAISRSYLYKTYKMKSPFLCNSSWYFPYTLDIKKLQLCCQIIAQTTDFSSFCKLHGQNNNNFCTIMEVNWREQNNELFFTITANRFLRGMVRGLVATTLKVATNKISITDFENIIASKNCAKAYFDAPAHGLYLMQVKY
jgi:tRNA pseudouridine38-40 synthase